jgi:hypothetical protein
MRDELTYLFATTALNLVAIMNFRIPDERFNVLLLILPTFFAVVIGIPLWLYLTSEVSLLAGICAVLMPFPLVLAIERMLSPYGRIGLSWCVVAFGVGCAHYATHSPFWQ